jgi:hypothetical protein
VPVGGFLTDSKPTVTTIAGDTIMRLHGFVAAAVLLAASVSGSPDAFGQEPGGEECIIEPIVIGGDPVDAEEGTLLEDPVAAESILGDTVLAEVDGVAATIASQAPCRCTGRCDHAAAVRDYVVFDVLFLDRDNATANQPILVDGRSGLNPGGTIFTTRSLVPTTGPGVRLFVGRHGCDTTGWEVGYWGVYGWYGDVQADVPSGLAVPGELGQRVPGWDSASSVRANWSSTLNVTEWNLLTSGFSTGCEPASKWPQRRCRHETEIDWIGGLFWAGLEEQAAMQVTAFTGAPTTSYRVATSSNLFGGQLGLRGRRTWDRFALEGWLKAGLGGAWLSQSASPITSPIGPPSDYRPGRSAVDTGMGFLSSMNLSMAYRFSDVWGLRIGYNLAWLSGVALAPNQWDFTDTPTSGTGVRGAGGLFLHGANVGLEARW